MLVSPPPVGRDILFQPAPPSVSESSLLNKRASAPTTAPNTTFVALVIVAFAEGVLELPVAEPSASSVVVTPENSPAYMAEFSIIPVVTVMVLPDTKAVPTEHL